MQKLTNKEEEIMQILWKLKSFCKAMAEITEINHTTTPSTMYVIWKKGYVAHNAYGKISITIVPIEV
jgi:predicted transcriptional regulator